MNTLQEKLGFQDNDSKTAKHDTIMTHVHRHAAEIAQTIIGIPQVTLRNVKWEVPLSTGSYIVGFLDMVIGTDQGIIVIEVKSKIANVGELLRQLNLYRKVASWVSECTIVVVSPDDHFADILATQGIKFYKYDPSPEDEAMQ